MKSQKPYQPKRQFKKQNKQLRNTNKFINVCIFSLYIVQIQQRKQQRSLNKIIAHFIFNNKKYIIYV